MSLQTDVTAFKAGVVTDITDKLGIADSIPPNTVATKLSSLADLLLTLGNGVPTYTIAQVKASTGTVLSGLFFISDKNRGGVFYVDSTDTTTTDDNGVVFVTVGGQRVKRIYNGPVDLAWFGLVNNDVALASSVNQGPIIDTVLRANRYGNYYIGKGVYWVDSKSSNSGGAIFLPSNINVTMHPQCVIKGRQTNLGSGRLIHMEGVENITLTGGEVVGDRYHNTGGGEWGMGVSTSAVRNLTIRDMYIRDCHGDGIYIAGGGSHFLNPKTPVSQLMQGTLNLGVYIGIKAGVWRCDVTGTGSLQLIVEGQTVPFATVTEGTSRHIQTPYTTGYQKIQATIVGTLTEVRFDCPTYDMTIDNIRVHNCRRNNISLICVMNWTISNAMLSYANGTLPQAGIDLEPNNATERIWNGRLLNVDAFDNVTQGFQITGHNIVMDNCNAYRNGNEGFYLSSTNGAGGDYFVNNCTAVDNGAGFQVQEGDRLVMNNVIIKNCNKEYGIQLAGMISAVLNNILIENTVGYGIVVPGNTTHSKISNLIMKTIATGGTQPAIYIRTSNCSIDNFNIQGAGQMGINTQALNGWNNNSFTNGKIEGCGTHGMSLGCDDANVVNVTVRANNVLNGSAFYNVEIKGNNTKLALCTIKKGATNPRYGIRVQTTANGTKLIQNDFAGGGGTGNISNLGTGTLFTLPTV